MLSIPLTDDTAVGLSSACPLQTKGEAVAVRWKSHQSLREATRAPRTLVEDTRTSEHEGLPLRR